MMSKIQDILKFWFGNLESDQPAGEEISKRWWKKDPDFDKEIESRFKDDILKAASGEYQEWESTAEGRLALIILLDQFTRNVFRNTPQAWAYDEIALKHCLTAIEQGQDRELHTTYASFLYMPLMHAENMQAQDESLKQFQALSERCGEAFKKGIEGSLSSAKHHYSIVERFGRYPHRNAVIGRESTAEELEFLTQKNSSF